MGSYIVIPILGSIFAIIIFILMLLYIHKKKQKIREQIKGLAENTLEMTPEEFFKMRNASFGGRGRPHML